MRCSWYMTLVCAVQLVPTGISSQEKAIRLVKNFKGACCTLWEKITQLMTNLRQMLPLKRGADAFLSMLYLEFFLLQTHMHVHVHTHVHTHTHIHMHMHTYAHVQHTCTHMNTRAHTCTHVHTRMCTPMHNTHTHAHTNMHTQTCTHKHAHTNMHTQTCTHTCAHRCCAVPRGDSDDDVQQVGQTGEGNNITLRDRYVGYPCVVEHTSSMG